jgi:hypothetical protein
VEELFDMITIRKFILFINLFEMFSYGDVKDYMPTYFDYQSSKGLQLLKAGFISHTFAGSRTGDGSMS